jgi:hypothetical protein
VALIGVINRGNTTPTTLKLEGYVSEFSVTNAPDFGISIGDEFQGTLSYESFVAFSSGGGFLSSPTHPSDSDISYLRSLTSVTIEGWLYLEITVDGQTFNSGQGYCPASLTSSPSGNSLSFVAWDDIPRTPWSQWSPDDSWLGCYLTDNLHYFDFSGGGGFYGQYYDLRGEVTSITNVPECGNTAMLLALVLVPLLSAFCRRAAK